MIPFVALRGDPFVGLVGAFSEIEADELALFQVIFSAARSKWQESIMRSVTHGDGSALFVNAPELLSGAKEKTSEPLFSAVMRVVARAPNCDRAWEIACNSAGALGVYGSPRGNELIPLQNEGYPPREHELDLLRRQTHRSGMLLSARELAGFVHLPSGDVRSPLLRPNVEKTKAAAEILRRVSGLSLGVNSHAGVEARVFVTDEHRARHVHVIGASGTGKSSLLYNLIIEDIENGYGCTVLDPHGDLIEHVLGSIPQNRVDDVILLDPADEEFVIPFNVLRAHSDWEKNLLASDLVAVFRRLSTAWGDQLNSVLSNALLAFMGSDQGGTLLDVRRFLLEPGFRADFLKSVRDHNLLYYWRHVFPALTGNKSVGPVVTRLDSFLSPKALRLMVAERENRIDFGDILDKGRIFLAKLPEGFIGKDNAHLLGSFLVSKIQSAAMGRQRESASRRRFHTLYADEFQNYLTPSLAECLTGVRKYGLSLVLAHHELRQVEREPDVASALLNAGTRIVFRVGDKDARTLEAGFASFSARDIQNLETGHAICRVERSDWDFNLTIPRPEYPGEETARERRDAVIAANRDRNCVARADVERAMAAAVPVEAPPPKQRTEAKRENSQTHDTLPVQGEKERKEPETVAKPVPSAVSVPVVDKAAVKVPPPIPDLGKGGAQHKAVQDRIKEEAERLGFRVTLEKEVLGGMGQIDLVLTRDGLSIACEVTVENTIDYEVGNVAKCIKAGFRNIAVIGVDELKLAKLASAVTNGLGRESALLTTYHLPDAFIAAIRGMPRQETVKSEPESRSRGGRVVKLKVVALSPEEAKAKEDEALRLMSTLMRSSQRGA